MKQESTIFSEHMRRAWPHAGVQSRPLSAEVTDVKVACVTHATRELNWEENASGRKS